MKNHKHKQEANHAGSLSFFLALSLGVLLWQTTFQTIPAPVFTDTLSTQESQLLTDTDRDGVPDHLDRCPLSGKGWTSGRATDFDSDGCHDGVEDMDQDNDGILDMHDNCPNTPQKYMFVSNTARDFDRDGCADGVEDGDDDGDSIPNAIDGCPLTASGMLSDSEGCSGLQREIQATGAAPAPQTARVPTPEEAEPTKLEGWINLIIGCGLQAVLGGVLSHVVEKTQEYQTSVQEQLSEESAESIRARIGAKMSVPTESVKRFSTEVGESWIPVLKKNSIRLLCYVCVFLYLRQHRCALASTSAWFAFGVRAIGGSCPEPTLLEEAT